MKAEAASALLHAEVARGRTPTARLSQRDCQILDVAERLFLESGYQQVSLARVASTAGVATRTIYARFGEKRALLDEVIKRCQDAADEALADIEVETLPIELALHRLATHAFVHALSSKSDLLHADLLAERDHATPSRRQWARVGKWRVLLEQALRPDGIEGSDAAPVNELAGMFVACVLSVHLESAGEWVDGGPTEQEIDRMARRVLARFGYPKT